MPPTSSKFERSFGCIRRNKNYLEINNEFFLTLIHVHKDMNIDVDRVINLFASDKCRKLDFLKSVCTRILQIRHFANFRISIKTSCVLIKKVNKGSSVAFETCKLHLMYPRYLCWHFGSHLWCLTVSLLLSNWYPGSGAVLDCIDSWSLHPYLLCKQTNELCYYFFTPCCLWLQIMSAVISYWVRQRQFACILIHSHHLSF